MKKIIVLAIAALPLFAVAQDKKEGAQPATTTTKPNEKPALTNPEAIYIELIITQGPAGSVIKSDIGREAVATLPDKDLVKQLSDLRTMSFSNMPDAMNYLATIGFKYQNTYVTYDKDQKAETHLVFEKRMVKRPVNDGAAKPNRPERPSESKPETKPVDKKPAAKEEKK